MTRYLITGGCGFIGSHLVDALLGLGHAVRVLDNLSAGRTQNLNPQAELIFGDVADPLTVRAAMRNTDGCFHLAALPVGDDNTWLDTHRTNLTGTVTVFDAARRDKLPVVYASSAAIYGENLEPRLAEGMPARPRDRRGADALSCEVQGRIAASFGVPNTALRLFHVYGPRQDAEQEDAGVVARFAARLEAGLPLTLQGDGEQTRDFVYVSDAVAYLVTAMQRLEIRGLAQADAFNMCSGRATRIRELATLMTRITGGPLDLRLAAPRGNDLRHLVGDPDFAAHSLRIRTQVPLEAGLRLTLARLLAQDKRKAAETPAAHLAPL